MEQDALAEMFATLLDQDQIDVGLIDLQGKAGDWATKTMEAGPGLKSSLLELGLWPDLTRPRPEGPPSR